MGSCVFTQKKLFSPHIHFLKMSVEEQRVQEFDSFSGGRQIAFMIYEYFRSIGAYESVQGLSDMFTARLQNNDVQDFVV